MSWEEIKKVGYLNIQNQLYSISHLQDKKYFFQIEDNGKHSALAFDLLVQYSSHCISTGQRHEEPQQKAPDFFDHGGNKRFFCKYRYQLSHHLPQVFATILARICYFTGHENWLTVEILNTEGLKIEYEIYFKLHRETNKFLRLYVESAYVRTGDGLNRKPKHFSKKEKVRAKILFSKKLRKQQLNKPLN